MVGKGSVAHNTRSFSAKNVDKERSCKNIEFCNRNLKEVYHELFDDALERYNAKQKRNDRKIDDYYEKIRQGKQEKLFHEVIFQIGNRDDTNAKSEEGQLAKEILTEFMEQFQRRNPNLHVFSAHLHMDEETPHLHIDFVLVIRESKRGLDTRVSLRSALGAQGFIGGTRGDTELNQWIAAEKKVLAETMKAHDIEWLQKGTHEKHLSVLEFEKKERAKEVEALTVEKEMLQAENQQLGMEQEELRQENKALEVENEELQSENLQLESEQKELQESLEQMVTSKTALERNVHAYDEDKKWQLPEATMLMSAKTYRDNYALPLVNKLKKIVKDLTVKCVQLMGRNKELSIRMERMEEVVKFLKKQVGEEKAKTTVLLKISDEFNYLKEFLGVEKTQSILANREKRKTVNLSSKDVEDKRKRMKEVRR
ncbi:MAG: plasmid recombination protein [Lachnospiraceae bacterium]|nr:plasmid recombination protein [Lachnospiraceae bacterium]